MMSLTQDLNAEQQRAANHRAGPLLVIAGAGSGKTRVVTRRIAQMIADGISPDAILGLTFTNKAAQEMQERITALTDHQVLVCTFHSLGARILRESIQSLGFKAGFQIYDEEDSNDLLKSCYNSLGVKDKEHPLKKFRSLISQAKNKLVLPHNIRDFSLEGVEKNLFEQLYPLYQAKLKEYNAVDFDDLLVLPVELFRHHREVLEQYQNRWQFVLIDEYQDTNAAQYTLTRLLADKTGNLFVVGDPDQSIYSWRGANIQNILNFEQDFPNATVVRLEQNYRSCSNILQAANGLIRYNQSRYEKNLWSNKGAGEKVSLFVANNDLEEADFVIRRIKEHSRKGVPLSEMVIFYRTNFQSRTFEDALMKQSLPYLIVGGVSFYQRREIKDILAFLRLVASDTDFMSFARTINLPKRGIGETTLAHLSQEATSHNLSIIAFIRALMAKEVHPSFKLSEKQRLGLQDYLRLLQQLRQLAQSQPLSDLVHAAIYDTGYLNFLKEDPETFEDRKENVDELVAKASEWQTHHPNPTLENFLEELALKSTLDEMTDNDKKLRLMTVHNGKGLEYSIVFIGGMEEDLFPHINAKQNFSAIEEERRLCYVGMTRAKEQLYLTAVRCRYLWGSLRMMSPSRFLREIPPEYLQRISQFY